MFLLVFHMPVVALFGVILILWMVGFVPAIGAIDLSSSGCCSSSGRCSSSARP